MFSFFNLQSDDEMGEQMEGEDGAQTFIAHVPVPSQKEVRNCIKQKALQCSGRNEGGWFGYWIISLFGLHNLLYKRPT